jgi:hypothetical protein
VAMLQQLHLSMTRKAQSRLEGKHPPGQKGLNRPGQVAQRLGVGHAIGRAARAVGSRGIIVIADWGNIDEGGPNVGWETLLRDVHELIVVAARGHEGDEADPNGGRVALS